MGKLTVLTWFWKQPGGRAVYTAEHVNIWASMVRRNLKIPHRIACVTAHPEGIDPRIDIIAPPGDFESVRIPTWGEYRPQCLRRIAMFRPDAAEIFGKRFVCMDMDCVIRGDITPLFEDPVDFKMFSGTHRTRPYNGSLLMMTAGARPEVYENFTPAAAIKAGRKYVGSDQAWISYVLGRGESTWGAADGIFGFGSQYYEADKARVVFFFGIPKPWEVPNHPIVREHYRMQAEGRALLLGYGPTLWEDVERALDGKPYAAVFCAPETAEHWTGLVNGTSLTDKGLRDLAYRHGYDDVTFCGATGEDNA